MRTDVTKKTVGLSFQVDLTQWFFPSIFQFKCNCSDSHLAEGFTIFKEKMQLVIKSSCGSKHSCWGRHPLR